MFESNFPVDKASCSYAVLWNAFKRIVQNFSCAERLHLFHDTAARAYLLPLHAGGSLLPGRIFPHEKRRPPPADRLPDN